MTFIIILRSIKRSILGLAILYSCFSFSQSNTYESQFSSATDLDEWKCILCTATDLTLDGTNSFNSAGAIKLVIGVDIENTTASETVIRSQG